MTSLTSASEKAWGLEVMAAVICRPSSDVESCGLAIDSGAASNRQAAQGIHIVRFAFMPDIVGEPPYRVAVKTVADRVTGDEPRACRGRRREAATDPGAF